VCSTENLIDYINAMSVSDKDAGFNGVLKMMTSTETQLDSFDGET
jgi:hypothetical protein